MRREGAKRNEPGGLKKPRVFVTTSDKAAKKREEKSVARRQMDGKETCYANRLKKKGKEREREGKKRERLKGE